MNKLTLRFDSLAHLQQQLAGILSLVGDTVPAPANDETSLALYSSDELLAELTMRQTTVEARPNGSPPEMPDDAKMPTPENNPVPAVAKRKRGRPPKAVSTQAATASATVAAADPATNEPAPEPAALPTEAAKPPDPNPASVAPELPGEDDMLLLLSETYSASDDMELVRNIMKEVGGKTQLSQIPVNLWPTLRDRLQGELARIKGQVQ